jgi:hypothetical protein
MMDDSRIDFESILTVLNSYRLVIDCNVLDGT